MTRSDPVLRPIPSGKTAVLRNDAARASADLATTVEALANRLDVRAKAQKQAQAAWKATAPILGACAAGAVAAVAVARLSRRDESFRGVRWSGEVAAGAGALTAGAAAYALVSRAGRPSPDGRLSPAARLSRSKALRPGSARQSADGRPMAAQEDSVSTLAGGDVVDLLMAQHRQVDGFFSKVRATEGAEKREAFSTLVEVLHRHEGAEQQTIHTVLRDLGGDAADVVTRRMGEEEAADRAITDLISLPVDHPAFTSRLAELQEMVHVHAAREESEEFPLLRTLVPGAQLRRMANEVRFAQSDQW